MGRSRGGLTCKIHPLCDAEGQPLHLHLTAGQTHESTELEDVLIGADEQPIDAQGKAVAWPVALAGDKGYRGDWIDAYSLSLSIDPVIPSKVNENRDSRTVTFDQRRIVIEVSSNV